MGVPGLWKLLGSASAPTSLDKLANMKLSVDASIWLVQFAKGMRGDGGESIAHSHLIGMYNRLIKLLMVGCQPLVVFDGATPALKKKTLEERRAQRVKHHDRAREEAREWVLKRWKRKLVKAINGEGKELTEEELCTILKEVDLTIQEGQDGFDDEVELEEEAANNAAMIGALLSSTQPPEQPAFIATPNLGIHLSVNAMDGKAGISGAEAVSEAQLLDILSAGSRMPSKNQYPSLVFTADERSLAPASEKGKEEENDSDSIEWDDPNTAILSGGVSGSAAPTKVSTSTITCQMCTYENELGARWCEICENKFPSDDDQVSCPQCTMKNASWSRFCKMCESRLPVVARGVDPFVVTKVRAPAVAEAPHPSPPVPGTPVVVDDASSVLPRVPTAVRNLVQLGETPVVNIEDYSEASRPQAVALPSIQKPLAMAVQLSLPDVEQRDSSIFDLSPKSSPGVSPPDSPIHSSLDLSSDSPTAAAMAPLQDSIAPPEPPVNVAAVLAESHSANYVAPEESHFDPSFIVGAAARSAASRIDEELAAEQEAHAMLVKDQLRLGGAGWEEEAVAECKELLNLFGVPFIVASFEAEAQCAALEKLNIVDGTISDDSDTLLFGCNSVFRSVFRSDSEPRLASIFSCERLGLSRVSLLRLGLLLGCDYTPGVRYVGAVTACEILSAFTDPAEGDLPEDVVSAVTMCIEPLVRFREWLTDSSDKSRPLLRQRVKKVMPPAGFPSREVVQALIDPDVGRPPDAERLMWRRPDIQGLVQFAVERMQWAEEKAARALEPLVAALEARDQRRPGDSASSMMRGYLSAESRVPVEVGVDSTRLRFAVKKLREKEAALFELQPRKRQKRPKKQFDDDDEQDEEDDEDEVDDAMEEGDDSEGSEGDYKPPKPKAKPQRANSRTTTKKSRSVFPETEVLLWRSPFDRDKLQRCKLGALRKLAQLYGLPAKRSKELVLDQLCMLVAGNRLVEKRALSREPSRHASEQLLDLELESASKRRREHREDPDLVEVNRAPVLVLWTACLASTAGVDWALSASLGRAIAERFAKLAASNRGVVSHIPDRPVDPAAPSVVMFDERIELTPEGVSLRARGGVFSTSDALAYLQNAFGARLEHVKNAMEELIHSYGADKREVLDVQAWRLYQSFRPKVSGGSAGWGQKGILSLNAIKALQP